MKWSSNSLQVKFHVSIIDYYGFLSPGFVPNGILPPLSFDTQAYLRQQHVDQRFLITRPQPQLIVAVNQFYPRTVRLVHS